MKMNEPLPEFPFYTYGTAELGKVEANLLSDISVARAAMEKDIWFHASREYNMGSTFMALRMAFDEARSQRPRLILKIRSESAKHLQFDVEDALSRLDIDSIDVVQLCKRRHLSREVVDDFLEEGPMFETCCRFKEKGLVKHFVLEVFETCSADALRAVRNDLFGGYIFYFNIVEREASRELYREIRSRGSRLLALRTMASGLYPGIDTSGFAANETKMRNHGRMQLFLDVYRKSGCSSWLEFNMAYLKGIANVGTTIGATSTAAHLDEYVETAAECSPLDPSLVAEIEGRQLEEF